MQHTWRPNFIHPNIVKRKACNLVLIQTSLFLKLLTYEPNHQAVVKDTYTLFGIAGSNFAENKIPIVDIVHIR
jgi:hypothetical protein